MFRFKYLGLLLVLTWLTACASLPKPTANQVAVTKNIKINLPSPSAAGKLNEYQLLNLVTSEESFSFLATLTTNDEGLSLNLLTATGISLANISYTPAGIEVTRFTDAATLPPANQILLAVMFCLWPQKAWQEALPKNMYIEETPTQRLLLKANKDVLLAVTYTKAANRKTPQTFSHKTLNYQLYIKNLGY